MHEFGRESDVVEILVRLEKVAAEASLLRELFIQKDERFSHMMSELGELRAMVIKAERENQENAMRIEKLDSILKTLDPMEIEKTLALKEKMIVEAQARVEKMEKMLEDLRSDFLQHAAKIDKLGNFESISKVYKDVDAILSTVKRKEDNINLTAGKVETTFFEMEKRLKEFEKTKPLMERMEDLSNEMIKSLSDIGIKTSNFITRDELEEFRKSIRERMKGIESFEEQMAKVAGELEAVKTALAGLGARIGHLSADSQGTREAQAGVKQDFERHRAALEEKLSHLSGSVDILRQRSMESTDRLNEVSASVARLEKEVHNLMLQLDAHTQKSATMEGATASFEELIKGVASTLDTLSEELEAVKKSVRASSEDLRNEQRRFESRISVLVSQIKGEYEAIKKHLLGESTYSRPIGRRKG